MISAQVQFLGINASLDSGKLPQSQYRYLLNGRVDNGNVTPVRAHKKIDSPIGKTGLFALGEYIVTTTPENIYYKKVDENTWSILDTNIFLPGKVRFVPVPDNYSNERITYTDDISSVKLIPANLQPIRASLLITNGTKHYRFYPNLDYEKVNTNYSLWTIDKPEYMPKEVDLIAVSGSKLYCTKGNRIFHSVSGRFYDFVINRNSTGDKGGDETTTYKSVGVGDITAMAPVQGGGLIVCSSEFTHAITPDYDRRIFGEPYLQDSLLFPVGAVNEYSILDVLGDHFIVTHNGIVSFNYLMSTKQISERTMVSYDINPLLKIPITNTASTLYKHYALFSLQTIFGPAIVVYDTALRAFVSIDLVPHFIKQFVRTKFQDNEYLYFIDENDDLYQAYAGTDYQVPELYIGDISPVQAGDYNVLDEVRVFFTTPVSKCQVTIMSDGRKTKTWIGSNSSKFSFLTHSEIAIKTGVVINWEGSAGLISVVTSWSPSSIMTTTRMEVFTDSVVDVITDSHIKPMGVYNNENVKLNVLGYYVAGGSLVSLTSELKNFTGTVYDVTTMRKLVSKVPIMHVGDLSNTGDEGELDAGFIALGTNAYVVPGNHDLDGRRDLLYHKRLKYDYVDLFNVRFLLMDSGLTTQGVWLLDKEAEQSWLNQVLSSVPTKFVVALVHRPERSYDNLHSAENTWVPRHPRIDLYLHGHAHLYQKVSANTIILGPSGGGLRYPASNIPWPYIIGPGKLKLAIDNFKITAIWMDINGNALDETVVRARAS